LNLNLLAIKARSVSSRGGSGRPRLSPLLLKRSLIMPICIRETSRRAAREIEPALSRLQQLVLKALRDAGPRGLADFEICAATGIRESTMRPRRHELVRAGLVADSGERRRTPAGRYSTVWILADTQHVWTQTELFDQTPTASEFGY
jgi:hypothetical protein